MHNNWYHCRWWCWFKKFFIMNGKETRRKKRREERKKISVHMRTRTLSSFLRNSIFLFIVFVVAPSYVFVTEPFLTMNKMKKKERIMYEKGRQKEIYIPHPVFIVIWVRFFMLCCADSFFFSFRLSATFLIWRG